MFLFFFLIFSSLVSANAVISDKLTSVEIDYFGTADFVLSQTPVPHWTVLKKGFFKRELGILLESSELCPEIKGFAGHVPLIVLIADNRVERVFVLPNNETPEYFSRLLAESYPSKFSGKTTDSLEMGDLDTVAGATFSSKGVRDEIAAVCRIYREKFAGGAFRPLRHPKMKWADLKPILTWIVLWISLYSFFKRPGPDRRLLLAANTLVLGLWGNLQLSMPGILLLIPLLKQGPGFPWIFFLLSLLASIPAGRFYCGYLCPFGMTQELIFNFSPFKTAVKIPAGIDRQARLIRFGLLIASILAYFRLANPFFLNWEPLNFFFTFNFPGRLSLALSLLLLCCGLFISRVYCRWLCPTGALISLLKLFCINKIRITSPCRTCNACSKTCPTNAIECGMDYKIHQLDCIDCNQCLDKCGKLSRRFQETISPSLSVIVLSASSLILSSL